MFAFALFAMTTASIMSGAVIERIRLGAYLILAIILGGFTWMVAASWGWNYWGWFNAMGYHDFGCSAVLHGVSGFFALGVLINLGPRIGKFDTTGKPRDILPHNLPLTMVGLMLIFVGFYAFLAACVIFVPGATGQSTIYGSPMTLASIGVNTTLALCMGTVGSFLGSKGDPFYTISGGLAGIISVGAGLDLYAPPGVLLIAFIGAYTMPFVGKFIEKMGIDDAPSVPGKNLKEPSTAPLAEPSTPLPIVRQERNLYEAMEAGKQVKKLPLSLGEALQRLDEDEVIKSAMPGDMYRVYTWYKRDEWEKFLATTTDWDTGNCLQHLPHIGPRARTHSPYGGSGSHPS